MINAENKSRGTPYECPGCAALRNENAGLRSTIDKLRSGLKTCVFLFALFAALSSITLIARIAESMQ